jgi:tripartite-type tricarboxylate transporter receptor subunit TctC
MVDKDVVLYLVNADSPWKTLKDAAEGAQKDPVKFRWASVGRGGVAIPAMHQFFRAAGVPDGAAVSQVIFRSGNEGAAALAGGHVDFASQQVAEASGLIEGKKLRAVAVVSDKRLPSMPDVPTVAEAGYPMLDVTGWHGVSGPLGLPQYVIDRWIGILKDAPQDPVFAEMLINISKVPVFLGPEEVKQFAEKEYEKYLEISRQLGWRK